ncbi:factor of DNA methylation 1-like [Euphorbia lathyris]|uniref:factor of DNA methylation 1-like n=1 Tax=Euphorbia lathyris TaxID=212925 RepID=UPI003313E809
MYQDSCSTVRCLMNEKVASFERNTKEIRNLISFNSKLKYDIESELKEIKQLIEELYESKSQNDLEQTKLRDEIKQLKEKLETQSPPETIDDLRKELNQKESDLSDFEDLCNTLIAKEKMANEELQDARKESICGLEETLSNRTALGIKRMGELDHKAFVESCKRKFPDEDWGERAAEVCSTWEEYLKDPNWHPLKMQKVKGKLHVSNFLLINALQNKDPILYDVLRFMIKT